MAGNGWEQLDMVGMAGNGWKLLEMAKIAGNYQKWQKLLEMNAIGLKCPKWLGMD